MFEDKKVIIVGPARYLVGENKGKYIDSFDIVVRMNYSVPVIDKKNYGSKTDILYTYFTPESNFYINKNTIKNWTDAGVKKIYSVDTRNVEKYKMNRLKENLNWETLSSRFINFVCDNVAGRPNTGTIAIFHLLEELKVKSLNVIGFDYYNTKYYDGYYSKHIKQGNWHDYDTQLIALDKLSIKNDRLILDNRLINRIEEVNKKYSIVIPYKKSDVQRDLNLQFLLNEYKKMFNFEIIISQDNNKDLNVSRLRNLGVKQAQGEYIILLDADLYVPKKMILDGIKLIKKQPYVISKKNSVNDLGVIDTRNLIKKNILPQNIPLSLRTTVAFMIISKKIYNKVGGYDERFKNWGGEDNAFIHTLRMHCPQIERVEGKIYHLWHPVQNTKKNFKNSVNYKLMQQYQIATSKEDLIKIKLGQVLTKKNKKKTLQKKTSKNYLKVKQQRLKPKSEILITMPVRE